MSDFKAGDYVRVVAAADECLNGATGYVDSIRTSETYRYDVLLRVQVAGFMGETCPFRSDELELVAAAPLHSGDDVTIHAAASRYDGRPGRVAAPDEEGGYEVAIDGEARLLHFELAELTPRRLIGTGGGVVG